jgi:anti-sigma B factor antagonist
MAQLQSTYRDAGPVTVLDLSGRITLGEPSALLRTTIKELLAEERLLILVNLADVNYIDSSGIGELVTAFTTVKNRGGMLKLLHLTKKVKDLLQITRLFTVFEVHENEREALSSFGGASTPA